MWNPRSNFKFTEEEYTAAKAKDYLPIQCMHCGQEGKARKDAITQVMTGKATNKALYCSNSCRAHMRQRVKNLVTIICCNCNDEFSVYPCRKKGRRRQKYWFCSNSCRLQFVREHIQNINETRRAEKEGLENSEDWDT